MNVEEIVIAFGAYYRNNGQNLKRILNMPFQTNVFDKYSTLIKTDETVYQMAQAKINSIVQGFQKGWTPTNSAQITPNEIRQYHFKVDEDINPDDVEATWLGFLASTSQKRSDWPLIKYVVETLIMPAIQRDMELKEYYKGVFVAPTTGTSSPTGNGMNGLSYLLNAGVNAGTINSVNIGTLDKDTIFDQVELFSDGINEEFQGMDINILMSPKWFKHYMRDKRAQGFFTLKNSGEVDNGVDFTTFNVASLPGMAGKDEIFATPKTNLLHLTKKSEGKSNVDVQESKRVVSLLTDWWEGAGFGINQAVWTNIRPTSSGSGSTSGSGSGSN